MASELDGLLAEFPEWTAAINAWHKRMPVVDYFAIMEAARGTDHGDDDYRRVTEAAYKQAGEHPNVAPLVERLCQLYLISGPDDRARIYQAFASNRPMQRQLESVYGSAWRRLRTPADIDQLRIALAAVAIEDAHGLDWRDTLVALGDLRATAEAAGIDRRGPASEVIALANTTPGCAREWPNTEGLLRGWVG